MASREHRKTHRSEIVGHICLTLFAVFVAFRYHSPYWDFDKAYYPAAKSILDTGTFTYTYEGVKNIPIVILFLVPFAAAGHVAGAWLFQVFSLLSYVTAFTVAVRSFAQSAGDVWVLLILFVSSAHIRTATDLGQLTPFVFLLVVLAIASYLRGLSALSGALIVVASLIKIPVVFLLLLLVRKWDWRGLTAAAVTLLSLVGLSVAIFGFDLHRDYWESVIVTNAGATLISYNNQSFFGFLMRFTREPAPLDWTTVLMPPYLYRAAAAVIVAWVMYLALAVIRREDGCVRNNRSEWSLLICTSVLIAPVSWDHYYLFLIVPFYTLYELLRERAAPPSQWLLGILSLALVNMPTRILLWPGWPSDIVRLIVISSPFLGGVLLLGMLLWLHSSRRTQPSTEMYRPTVIPA